MRSAIIGWLLMTAAACSPAQRQIVGGGVAAAGVGVTFLAIESMADSCPHEGDFQDNCLNNHERAAPTTALPVALGGLGIAFLGGVLMASSIASSRSPPRPRLAAPPPAAPLPPSVEPTALDETEAVGMAVSRLVLAGVDAQRKPTKLLGVDNTQVSLSVAGRYAELQRLRVRTASDGTWVTVGACYEFDGEWRLTSLATPPKCPR